MARVIGSGTLGSGTIGGPGFPPVFELVSARGHVEIDPGIMLHAHRVVGTSLTPYNQALVDGGAVELREA